jgi:hypothetical protein
MEETPPPAYRIGDFVRCVYDMFDFFGYWYHDEEYEFFPFYGVVVDMVDDEHWFTEVVYQVYCLDGQYRFFLEDEIERVNNPAEENP